MLKYEGPSVAGIIAIAFFNTVTQVAFWAFLMWWAAKLITPLVN